MRLAYANDSEAVSEATDIASDVSRIIYRKRSDGLIDVGANRKDENGPCLIEFTLRAASKL